MSPKSRAKARWGLLLGAGITLALSGCQGLTTAPPSDSSPPATPSLPASCAVPTLPPVTQQYLFGIDIMETPNVWAYKIDNQTGALTQMPWSPFQTYNHGTAAAADPSGKFIYIASQAPLFGNNTPQTLETFAISDGPPVALDRQEAGYALKLDFDPQQKFFYIVDGFRVLNPPNDGKSNSIQAYAPRATGVPERAGEPVLNHAGFGSVYAYKRSGNLLLIAHVTETDQPQHTRNGVSVFRQDCASGRVSFVAENIFPDMPVLFLAAPATGDLVIAWNASRNPARAWVYRIDPLTGVLTQRPNGIIEGVQRFNFDDPRQQFGVAVMADDPRFADRFNTVVLYRIDIAQGLVEADRYVQAQLPPGDVYPESGTPIFDRTGNFLYVASTSRLYGFRIDRDLGKLTLLPGFPLTTQTLYYPIFIAAQR